MFVLCKIKSYRQPRTCRICGVKLHSYISYETKMATSDQIKALNVKTVMLSETDTKFDKSICCKHNDANYLIMV